MHKPVSRCKERKCGSTRYNAVAREMEFGIGQYNCPKCTRVFFAHCEFSDILDCRKCHTACQSPIIHPKWKKKARKLNPNAEPFHPRPGRKQFARPPEKFTEPVSLSEQDVPPSSRGSIHPSVSQPRNPIQKQPYAEARVREDAGREAQAFAPALNASTGLTEHMFLSQSEGGESKLSLDYDEDLDNVSDDDSVYPRNPASQRTSKPYTEAHATREESHRGQTSHRPSPEQQRPKRKHAFNPSSVHVSTGSTNSSVSQTDYTVFEKNMDYDDNIPDDQPYPRRFECEGCANKYTVRCKMRNKAPCYECRSVNMPLGPAVDDRIDRTSNRKHQCDECPTDRTRKCPNQT